MLQDSNLPSQPCKPCQQPCRTSLTIRQGYPSTSLYKHYLLRKWDCFFSNDRIRTYTLCLIKTALTIELHCLAYRVLTCKTGPTNRHYILINATFGGGRPKIKTTFPLGIRTQYFGEGAYYYIYYYISIPNRNGIRTHVGRFTAECIPICNSV